MTKEEKIFKLVQSKAKRKNITTSDWLVSIMDSLSRYELIYDLENEFDIEIDEGDAQRWETIDDIVKYIKV